jgi:hypothetical protein
MEEDANILVIMNWKSQAQKRDDWIRVLRNDESHKA